MMLELDVSKKQKTKVAVTPKKKLKYDSNFNIIF